MDNIELGIATEWGIPLDLIYSPDDNGFYWSRISDYKTSQIFISRNSAFEALSDNKIIWS